MFEHVNTREIGEIHSAVPTGTDSSVCSGNFSPLLSVGPLPPPLPRPLPRPLTDGETPCLDSVGDPAAASSPPSRAVSGAALGVCFHSPGFLPESHSRL